MENRFGDLLKMENKEFKKILSECAKKINFTFMHGGWFKESSECIIVLDLQRSNYSNYYYLNIKIYVQGAFGYFSKSKELIKDVGMISSIQPKKYDELFNLENDMLDEKRKCGLENFFQNYLKPFSEKALTRSGIKELVDEGEIGLFPAVKEELGF